MKPRITVLTIGVDDWSGRWSSIAMVSVWRHQESSAPSSSTAPSPFSSCMAV